MISAEKLEAAAAASCGAHVTRQTADFDPEYRWEFSSRFEKAMNKLKRRAEHPIRYHACRHAAVIVLALLMAGVVWISVDMQARAAFSAWFSEITGSYFAYHHEQATDSESETADYRPSWLPEGYAEASVSIFHGKTTVRYKNDAGDLLRFGYVNADGDYNLFFDLSRVHMQSSRVGDHEATLFVSDADDVANGLTWVGDEDILFFTIGFVSETELVRIAESVQRLA